MLEKPRLNDERIGACLKTSYGLTVTGIEFLPLGYDSYAAVYRVWVGEQSYFLKMKSDPVQAISIRLPHYLNAQGITQVVAPLPTITGDLWGQADSFTVLLYPFIEEITANLSDNQWIEFGSVLKKLHTLVLPPDLLTQVPSENFVPPQHFMAPLKQLHAEVCTHTYDHPLQRQLAAFWRDRMQDISRIIERTGQLGRQLHARPVARVLCHADIHTGNLLLTAQGQIFVVDWDQPVLAPRERDLMFVTVGGFVTDPRAEALFFQGYGPTVIDPLPMAYYRYERTLEDLADFARRVFWQDVSDATRQDSMEWFMRQFGPNSPVEAAYQMEPLLED